MRSVLLRILLRLWELEDRKDPGAEQERKLLDEQFYAELKYRADMINMFPVLEDSL